MAQTSKLRFHKRADWKSGKAKGKHLTSGMKYYTWRGRDKDQGRAWETGDGRTLTYWQARDEILDAKNRAGYTYTFVCGTKTEELDADEYREVLRGRFDRVYFVRHHDQGEGEDRHPHAHVIGFREKYMGVGEINATRERIGELEAEHERRRERERVQGRAWDLGL